ncbi:Flp pilus assembly protein CpaB [Blastococcus saxobsidens]|uniref:Pilus assembly protein n=1 Tax=Blastococcus saxobsidens (strain DD2) TaxID=1146883 RepID=H6RRU0_BLASD|nr:RcpC/CpaB family pilus assembly protein [Blastococcus saxobsidens]CCG02934.1 pilus assembly protein [Blastococcus saxobsidens DD2]
MNRRIIAALAALALAIVGTVVLVSYVRGADARALKGVETTAVLVVTRPITEGTPAGELADSVRLEQVPNKVLAAGTVNDLTDLGERVATVDLQPGEQVLASRFADESSLLPAGIVEPEPGDSEVSVLLEPQRAVGGRLAAGDEIGVYISMDLEANIDEDPEDEQIGTTHATLHGVLVTQVQGAPARTAPGNAETASTGTAAPSGSVMVTLALPAREAEQVVFAMEHGSVWLTLEPEGADTSGTRIVTQNDVYGDAVLGRVSAGGVDE